MCMYVTALILLFTCRKFTARTENAFTRKFTRKLRVNGILAHEMISELIPMTHELERSAHRRACAKGTLMSPLAVLLWSSGRKSDTPDLMDQN